MMDNFDKLRPCPWCHNVEPGLLDLWGDFDAGHIARVHCERCGADGPSVYNEQGAGEAIKQARIRWNARAPGCVDKAE